METPHTPSRTDRAPLLESPSSRTRSQTLDSPLQAVNPRFINIFNLPTTLAPATAPTAPRFNPTPPAPPTIHFQVSYHNLDHVRAINKAKRRGDVDSPSIIQFDSSATVLGNFKRSLWEAISNEAQNTTPEFSEEDVHAKYRVGGVTSTIRKEGWFSFRFTNEDYQKMRDLGLKHKSKTIWIRMSEVAGPEPDVPEVSVSQKTQCSSQSKRLKSLIGGAPNRTEDLIDIMDDLKKQYPCSKPSHTHCKNFNGTCVPLGRTQLTVWAEKILSEKHREESHRTVSLDHPPNLPIFFSQLGIAKVPTPTQEPTGSPFITPSRALGRSTSLNSITFLNPPPTPDVERSGTPSIRNAYDSNLTSSYSFPSSQQSTGPCMNIDTFSKLYDLSPKVLAVLRDLGFRGPQYLVHFSLDNFLTARKTKGGFGLKLGEGAELIQALDAWKKGLDLNGDPLDLF